MQLFGSFLFKTALWTFTNLNGGKILPWMRHDLAPGEELERNNFVAQHYISIFGRQGILEPT